jgi:hypothetical protein
VSPGQGQAGDNTAAQQLVLCLGMLNEQKGCRHRISVVCDDERGV